MKQLINDLKAAVGAAFFIAIFTLLFVALGYT